jgi:hypothetical protein
MIHHRVLLTLYGALVGSIAIGVQAVVSATLVWPVAYAGSSLALERPSVALASAVGVGAVLLILLGGAAVSGTAAATLMSIPKRLVGHQPITHFWRSAGVWGAGCLLSMVIIVLVSLQFGVHLLPLALLALVCGALISLVE